MDNELNRLYKYSEKILYICLIPRNKIGKMQQLNNFNGYDPFFNYEVKAYLQINDVNSTTITF